LEHGQHALIQANDYEILVDKYIFVVYLWIWKGLLN